MELSKPKTNDKKYYLHLLLLLVFGLYVFLRSDPLKISVEKNIYDYYSESIVKDQDLNVINQVPDKERWQITASGNYPDMHSNGIVSFWYPFFVYKSLVEKSLPIDNGQAIFLTRTMATSFYALFAVVLMLYWIKKELEISASTKELIIFTLGGSFLWFAILQPGNADITSLTIALMELIYFRKILKENLPSQYFLFGLLLGIGLTVKIDHFFFLLLPAYAFLNFAKKQNDNKLVLKSAFLFFAGLLINVIPLLINDSIKFGFMDYGYRTVLASDYYLLWENLFYPSGYLNNNPIYILSFLGLLALLLEKNKRIDLIVIGLIPVFSIVTESFARIHQESYGSRHWIAYLPSLLMLYLIFLKRINTSRLSSWLKNSISFISVLMVLQNVSKMLQNNLNYKKFFLGIDQYNEMLVFIKEQNLISVLGWFFNYPLLQVKLTFYLPLIVLCLGFIIMVYWLYIIKKNDLLRLITIITFIATFNYLAITILNVKNNHVHYLAFKQTGLLDKSIIGDGPYIHTLYENLGTTEKTIEFHMYHKNFERVEYLKRIRANYIDKAIQEIVYDPIEFKTKLKNDSWKFIRNELRVD